MSTRRRRRFADRPLEGYSLDALRPDRSDPSRAGPSSARGRARGLHRRRARSGLEDPRRALRRRRRPARRSLRRLGSPGGAGERRGGVQRLERRRPPHAPAGPARRLGDVRAGPGGRRALRVRDPHPAGGAPGREDGSPGVLDGAASEHRGPGRAALGVCLERRALDGVARRAASSRPTHLDLRGPPRLLAPAIATVHRGRHSRSGSVADVPRARRRARSLREGPGVHAPPSCSRSPSIRSTDRGGTRSPATSRRRRATARPTTFAPSSTRPTRRSSG